VGSEPYPPFDPRRYPHLAAALSSGSLSPDEATIQSGLDALLDGIQCRGAPSSQGRR
jgi:hypothetical protein